MKTPNDYACSKCNARFVKLWRSFGHQITKDAHLLCADCATAGTSHIVPDARLVATNSRTLDIVTANNEQYVPAVPVAAPHFNDFWPLERMTADSAEWWSDLPTLGMVERPIVEIQARAIDPVAGDANTSARWLVLINREGVYEIRNFSDELAARESFDTNGAQWSDSYLCAIVRGPGPNPGQPGAIEPMMQEVLQLRRQRDAACKALEDLRARVEEALRPAPLAPADATDAAELEKPSDDLHDRAIEALEGMLPEEIAALSVEAGVHTAEGNLTPEYGGPDPVARPAPTVVEPFDPATHITIGRVGDPPLDGWDESKVVVVKTAGPPPAMDPQEPVARPAMSEQRKAEVRAEFVDRLEKSGPPPADVPLVGGVKGPRDKSGRSTRVGDEIRIRGTKRWVLISRIRDEHGTTWAVLPDGSSICIPTSDTRKATAR